MLVDYVEAIFVVEGELDLGNLVCKSPLTQTRPPPSPRRLHIYIKMEGATMTSVLFCSLNLKPETEATKRQKNQVRSWSYYLTDFYMHLSELKSFKHFHSDFIHD